MYFAHFRLNLEVKLKPMLFADPKLKPLVGVVHVQALPGTPCHKYSMTEIIEKAIRDSEIYLEEGVNSILIENMHDCPYLNREVGPEIIAGMTAVCSELRKLTNKPLGIQILAGANKAALAVALASGLQYIRVEGFVFSHIADEGQMDSDAGELLRYRANIGANQIQVFTDIKKKHSSHSLTADITISETAKAAAFFLSNGVIISGASTGVEPDLVDLKKVKESVDLPVIIGSGITTNNIDKFYPFADAFIVGSFFKADGKWENDVDTTRVKEMIQKINYLRKL